jgi:hypothetical protein
MVSSRYSSGGFLSVWYQSQYDLASLTKRLMLCLYCISDNKYFIYLIKRPILEKAHQYILVGKFNIFINQTMNLKIIIVFIS